MRQLRWPDPTVEFNKLKLDVCDFGFDEAWWNLRWAAHMAADNVFHASNSGRLTPDSGTIKCIYIAERDATSFYEIYGDDLALAKENNEQLYIAESDLKNRTFATVRPHIVVHLYDFRTEGSAKKIGMDLNTLYTEKVEHPRRFAQRVHDHPNQFDGIIYTSRHTQGPCIVLWPTYSPALKTMSLNRHSSLCDHARFSATFPPGHLGLFDDVIAVAAP